MTEVTVAISLRATRAGVFIERDEVQQVLTRAGVFGGAEIIRVSVIAGSLTELLNADESGKRADNVRRLTARGGSR